MGTLDQLWRQVRTLGWYRRVRAAQRILAVAFLAVFIVVVVGAIAGLAKSVWIAALAVAVVLGVAGGVLAWTVVAVMAVRFARRTPDPADERFTLGWLVPLAASYMGDVIGADPADR
jgi:ABC-type xylose transport system permease subunit